ncbi:alpha-tocopherol transfer protein-like [Cephus cinctus]|uniref:Alpha-tocopherol transfer protein-like n=1 Tax=Cephus cinctus TaxID=211228 RepID=A0AAJ7FHN9_CEPCN|nr:alpha-tocopherol transfer protein-like [Cephus cinctus]XP_015592328.1 alpha-tocopherol transfer protein-like [Cephus cinctus]XP_024939409.1 alpha-tocopherol transfer protein-like [Cephus cinctus]
MAENKNFLAGRQASLIERSKVTPKIKVGKHELTFQPDELDEFYKNKARTELREIPEVVDTSLRELREYIRGEPGLVVPEEEEYLIKFLRPCKWYAKSAFELMKRFYKYRLSHPRICEGLVPSKEKAIFISGILTPLPLRCNSGERILLLESGRKWKPKEISLEQIFKGVMLALEAAMAEPTTQVAGVRVILDMDGLSLSQVTYFTPSFASAVLEWVQKCLPCRLKGVHIVNQPYIFNMVFAIFKPFFQEKLRKRLHFHGSDRASLLSFIDAKALPTQYGGQLELPSEPLGERLWEYFCTYEEDFQASQKYGYVSST